MCRILLVEDAVPEPEALRVLIEQHPCAGAIQLESCAFSQVSERISQSPRIDALFAPVDAPGAFPACASDERAGIALVRELQDRDILPLTVYCTTRAAYTSAVYGTDHQYLLLAPYSPTEARNALDKVFGLLGHRTASPLALRSAGTVHIVDPADVVYVKSIGRKVLVRLSDARVLESYAALAELEQQLPGSFVRCHKSYLANMEHVVQASADGLVMDCDEAVPISQRQYRTVRDALRSFSVSQTQKSVADGVCAVGFASLSPTERWQMPRSTIFESRSVPPCPPSFLGRVSGIQLLRVISAGHMRFRPMPSCADFSRRVPAVRLDGRGMLP